ncbi:MAG TPA: glycoside hydrolase family 15 protein [Actinomycetota bacterium]|nr:glycoside hydrolase family 15 protein [Actinomycetota bacterium]
MSDGSPPPIGEYAFLSDCQGAALVSRDGAVDWCCMPRFDSGPVFDRLLDWEGGGCCQVRPSSGDFSSSREYVGRSLVLATTFDCPEGRARVTDCLATGGAHRELIRLVEGLEGSVPLSVEVRPRFDYGGVRPWVRQHAPTLFSAVGGNDALVISSDMALERTSTHDLTGAVRVAAGERRRLSVAYWRPEDIDPSPPTGPGPDALDERVEATVDWWQAWGASVALEGPFHGEVVRSALVLKGLTFAPTGAVVAAPTASLPEEIGGSRNWDYRYSWIRDSQFSVRSLTEVGCTSEADRLRGFIERTTAGSAESLQIMYGVGGERRLTEVEVDLAGYRGSRPVRVGNAAAGQRQLDAFGYLVELAWRWHERGHSPDEEYWRFLVSVVDRAVELWPEPDSGIWEMRCNPQHFVHSKVMCWAALDRAVRMARATGSPAPVERWAGVRDEIRAAVERDGYDPVRGVFRQAFGSAELDAALLLLPTVDFVAATDDRMVRTTDAVAADLEDGGLVRRYRSDDQLPGTEGTFLACTFWLAEILALQGRREQARQWFDRARSAANELGLFPEESSASGEALGNFPQGLTHLSHIAAAVALCG